MVAPHESAALAEKLIRETCERQAILPGQLTLHADRGSSMKSKPVAFLLADLGVTKTHSRPSVSDDNPFSEAHFKTLKYRPDFPQRFGSLEDARAHCVDFFSWYNQEHHHSGLGLLTPADVHSGFAPARLADRGTVLSAAFLAHPERFTHGPPSPAPLPTEVWINKPIPSAISSDHIVPSPPSCARAPDGALLGADCPQPPTAPVQPAPTAARVAPELWIPVDVPLPERSTTS